MPTMMSAMTASQDVEDRDLRFHFSGGLIMPPHHRL
jgi:hypothetical protein